MGVSSGAFSPTFIASPVIATRVILSEAGSSRSEEAAESKDLVPACV
jgi:hypothetical protein